MTMTPRTYRLLLRNWRKRQAKQSMEQLGNSTRRRTTLSPTSPAPVPSPTADEHDDRPGESPASGRSASQT